MENFTFMATIDHIAVGVFAITGALVASRKQMNIFGFILLGTVTGIGGGIIRDVLGGEVSLVLKKEIYVTAALLGAATFVGLQIAGVAQTLSFAIGLLTCFSVRALALRFSWSLPTYKSRPGR
jgi:uncharacterized membrane protein YeiH